MDKQTLTKDYLEKRKEHLISILYLKITVPWSDPSKEIEELDKINLLLGEYK